MGLHLSRVGRLRAVRAVLLPDLCVAAVAVVFDSPPSAAAAAVPAALLLDCAVSAVVFDQAPVADAAVAVSVPRHLGGRCCVREHSRMAHSRCVCVRLAGRTGGWGAAADLC